MSFSSIKGDLQTPKVASTITMTEITREQINSHFENLEKLLATRMLPSDSFIRGTSQPRLAQADEFMLMGIRNGFVQFKHSETRNYVFMTTDGQKLEVPQTSQAFMLGTF